MHDAPSPARRPTRPPGDSERAQLLAGLPLTEHNVELAGIATTFYTAGEGTPVVLLHGPAAAAVHWMGVLPDLISTHRVVVPDLPGHGGSKVESGVLDAERVILWLAQLIDNTCRTPPHLAGQTLGGAIAARLAIQHPRTLRSLALIDTLGLAPFAPPPGFAAAIGAYLHEPTARTHEQLWRHCAFDLPALRARLGERWRSFAAFNVAQARDPGMRAAVGALLEHFAAPMIPAADLAAITVPTTLVWGRHDLATPLAVAQAASARLRWPLHVIEGAADDPPVEQPEALLRALRAAFSENAATARRRA